MHLRPEDFYTELEDHVKCLSSSDCLVAAAYLGFTGDALRLECKFYKLRNSDDSRNLR